MSKARASRPSHFVDDSARPTTTQELPLARPWAQVRLRALFALPLLTLFLLGGRAEACPLTNPQCTVEQADKTVQETVEEAPEVVEEAADPVKETVEQVENTVEQTTDQVRETVDETLDPGSSEVEPPVPPRDPENPPPGNNKNEDPRLGDRVKGDGLRSDGSVWRPDERSSRSPAAATRSTLETLTSSSGTASAPENDGLAESVLEAAKDFAFPLLLTILVGAFLAIQHRFDRRDPKLVLAPLDHDYLSFE